MFHNIMSWITMSWNDILKLFFKQRPWQQAVRRKQIKRTLIREILCGFLHMYWQQEKHYLISQVFLLVCVKYLGQLHWKLNMLLFPRIILFVPELKLSIYLNSLQLSTDLLFQCSIATAETQFLYTCDFFT